MSPTPKPFGWTTTLLLLGIVVALAVLPLVFIRDSEFGGADGAAQEAIGELAPEYKPWFSPLIEPPGPETESLLFALQAALGAGGIGYFFGLKRGERRAGADAGATPVHSGSRVARYSTEGVTQLVAASSCNTHQQGWCIIALRLPGHGVAIDANGVDDQRLIGRRAEQF
jgi:cobalt/nickel transport protein